MLSKKIKIVIADDHRIFREGLKLMLAGVPSVDVIGEAADGAQLIALVASTAPDVIITDVKMPNLTGTEAVKILCAKYPGIRIIALTSFGEDQQII
jgi:DNA-binding NarL/FixJ family response regulator